jgi:hypothetical protein
MITMDNTAGMLNLLNARLAKQGLLPETKAEPEVVYNNAVIPCAPVPVVEPIYTNTVIAEDVSGAYGVVDAETGEVTPKPVQLGIAEKAMALRESYPDITNTVIEAAISQVLETIYTNTVINESEEGAATPAKRGPKAKVMINNFHEYFFQLEYEDDTGFVLESKVEDVLIVACRNTHPNTVIPIGVLVRCLKMPAITTNTVLNCMNKTRKPEQHIGERYARTISAACRKALEGMQRLKDSGQLNTNTVFNFDEDAQGYASWVMAGRPAYTSALTNHHVFTEEERQAIRAQYGVTGKRDGVNV